MLKIIITLLLLLISLNAQVVTKTNIKTAEGIGTGFTRDEAISNAIAEALGQLNGVKVSKDMLKTAHSIKSTQGNQSTYTYDQAIRRITKGRVDSYKILNVDEIDGKYEASVSIKKVKITKKYETPGLDHKKRRSIVVVPSNLNNDSFSIFSESKSSVTTNINLSQELLNSITQTRKFNVLDREESRAFYSEQNVLRSQNVQKDEALKLGNVLGADYLLLTSIKDMSIKKETANKYISNMNDSFVASLIVQFKVITTATRQVKFSATRTYTFTPKGNSNKEIYYDTLAKISNAISTELIENIYPIKVSSIEAGNIILNQGNLIVGSQYQTFKLGKKIIDSYTKESLGRSETQSGIIEIVRVLPKYCVAKLIEGTVTKGDIIRSFYLSEETKEGIYNKVGRESNAEVTESGGVKLPF